VAARLPVTGRYWAFKLVALQGAGSPWLAMKFKALRTVELVHLSRSAIKLAV